MHILQLKRRLQSDDYRVDPLLVAEAILARALWVDQALLECSNPRSSHSRPLGSMNRAPGASA